MPFLGWDVDSRALSNLIFCVPDRSHICYTSSICFISPGQCIVSRALYLHLFVPTLLQCILSSTSCCGFLGTTTFSPLKISSLAERISSLKSQNGLSSTGNSCLVSRHLSITISLSSVVFGLFVWLL